MTDTIDADAVLAFLKANPDFLNANALNPTLTSFDAFKQRKLQAANDELRVELDALIHNAERNQATVENSMKLVLQALDAAPGVARAQAIVRALRDEFKVDTVRVLILGDGPSAIDDVEYLPLDTTRGRFVEALLASALPFVGRLSEDRRERLFGSAAAALESCALARLDERDAQGLLALGANDVERFHPGTGGFLLEPLALVIGRLLKSRP